MSVRLEKLGSHWTDFHEIWYLSSFRKICWENSSFIKIRQEYGYRTWRSMYIFFLRIKNVSDENCKGKQNTHFAFSNISPLPTMRAVYEEMWKSVVEPGRPQMTIRCMRFACRMSKATDCPVHRREPDGHLQRVTTPDAVLIQFDLLMMSTTLLETCRGL